MGVTEEQVIKHKLPKDPDVKTLEKLNKDSRSNGFKDNHNGQLFQVEVDSLPAWVPEEFEKMVLEPVDAYFDENIHSETMAQYAPSRLRGLVSDRVDFLDEQ